MTNVNGDEVPRTHRVALDQRRTNRLPERRRHGAAGHRANHLPLVEHGIMRAGNPTLLHHKPYQAALHARGLEVLQGLSPDERALVELGHPPQAHFKGIRRLVHILSIQQIACLQTQSIPGGQADREQPMWSTCGHDGLPDGNRVGGLEEDFKAIFASIAGACHQGRRVPQPGAQGVVVGQGCQWRRAELL